MTTTVEKTIDIAAPISAVYNQWTQFESFPQFMDGVKDLKQVDATHTHWVMSINGIKREFDAETTEQRQDELISWKSTDGPDHAGRVTFERIGENETRVNLSMDWAPEGALEKVGSALNVDDREAKRDLDNFKELMESNGFKETSRVEGDSENAVHHEREPATPASPLAATTSTI